MSIKLKQILNVSLYIGFFLNFIGYYCALGILIYLGEHEASRILTVPIRLIIVSTLAIAFMLGVKKQADINTGLFLMFSFFYISRVVYGIFNNANYYISYEEVLLYFMAFSFFPFLFMSLSVINSSKINLIRKAIFLSAFVFALLSIYFYQEYLGSVKRLSSSVVGDDVLSPLALSYCGALTIGMGISYLMENKLNFRAKAYLIGAVSLAAIPFFLGASRGALIALAVPFVLMGIRKTRSQSYIKFLVVTCVIIVLTIVVANKLGSSIIERVTGISESIERGEASAERILIWKQAFKQFSESPIIGGELKVTGYNSYPHNLFIEALMTIGIVGFIPLLLLIISGFKETVFLFQRAPQDAWVGVIFLQSFVQSLFSGGLYTASWLWLSLGLLFAVSSNIRYQRTK